MFPILIDLGRYDLPLLGETHLFLPSYGVLFALGVVLSWVWFMRRTKDSGIPEEQRFNLAFYSVLAGIVGAKVLLILIDWRTYLAHPKEILGTIRTAGVLMGGVFAAAVTFYFYCKKHRLPTFELADAIVAPLALAQALGRLGCFSAGCCWGIALDPSHPLAVVFSDPQAREQTGVPLGMPLFPTQLTEMTFDLVLVVVLTVMWRRSVRPPGTILWTYVLLYSVGRGIIEIWRGDAHRGIYFDGAVSTSQAIATATALLAIAMLALGRRARKRSDGTPR